MKPESLMCQRAKNGKNQWTFAYGTGEEASPSNAN